MSTQNSLTQPTESNNRIDLIVFLTRRIVCAARLSVGANPAQRRFWLGQIADFHRILKTAMTNPVFRARGER
jgi:hypothetical protein